MATSEFLRREVVTTTSSRLLDEGFKITSIKNSLSPVIFISVICWVSYPTYESSIRYVPSTTSNRNFPSKSVVIPSIKLSLAVFFKITFAKGSGTLNSPSITVTVITDCQKLNVVIKKLVKIFFIW